MASARGTVCAGEDEAALLSDCDRCGAPFHLNRYANRSGRDCGETFLGPTLAVQCCCARCLALVHGGIAAPAPPAVAPGGGPPRRFRRSER